MYHKSDFVKLYVIANLAVYTSHRYELFIILHNRIWAPRWPFNTVCTVFNSRFFFLFFFSRISFLFSSLNNMSTDFPAANCFFNERAYPNIFPKHQYSLFTNNDLMKEKTKYTKRLQIVERRKKNSDGERKSTRNKIEENSVGKFQM